MKIIYSLKQDLNKTLLNIGFLGAVLLTAVLCFTAPTYHDLTTDRSYSVFESFFSFKREFIESDTQFASISVFQNGLGGYISMFLPIIVAFPFMVSFCAERNSGLMRFTISRTGCLRYYLSKFFAVMIGGGLAAMLGYAIYGLVVYGFFPNINSYELDEFYYEMHPDSQTVEVLKMLLSAFIYGAVTTLPAFLISSFSRNPYLITCVPFLMVYIWNTAINKLVLKAWETEDNELSEKLFDFQPDSARRLVYITEWNESAQRIVIFNGVLVVGVIVLFSVIMNLRKDRGV
ncbi:ABC transporter permease [Ruminococcus sp. NK3A76]|uniref:ABC transporter permease n=1 Tax=Ruminococcus sp. NK3A76 TaxID=877411 RepID=UPI00048A5971|nr:ABC transporter permease [Ruminococcus sp. NK3A76]